MIPLARLTALLDKLDRLTIRCAICTAVDRDDSAVTMISGTPLCRSHAAYAAKAWLEGNR